MKIPVYKPSIGALEKQYVDSCLESSWISSKGEFVERFENLFAERTGITYATTVCNGTVALHLALLSLGIADDDEVIVPTFTYIASVNCIHYVRAKPVFVDCLPDTWQLNPLEIDRRITPKTKAIMAVHIYGHPCDMDAICTIAKKHGLFVIEDCAEAFGTKLNGKHVGSFGDIATYSFYGNKTITTGEGGMVTTDNEALINRANHLKGQGLAEHRQYWHDTVGYNYRLTNVACAIGLAQLERAQELLARKRVISDIYQKSFEVSPYEFHKETIGTTHSYWMCSILIKKEHSARGARDKLRQHLGDRGIETRPLFYPVHTMPMHYSKYEMHRVAEDISGRGINLPSFPDLTSVELSHIIDSVLSYEF